MREDIYQREFANRLTEVRISKGLTRKEVAALLGIHDTTYGKYELGRREPSLELIRQIADLFYVTADYLIGRAAFQGSGFTTKEGIRKLVREELSDAKLKILLKEDEGA